MTKNTTSTPKNEENLETLKNTLKDELRYYIDDRLDDRFLDKIENTNKKLLREKTTKIIVRDIIILILLALSIFLSSILYNEGYFNQFFSGTSTPKTSETIESNNSNSGSSAPKNEVNLKEKYAPLLENFKLPKTSIYLSDFTSGKLTDNLKLYFALNSLNLDNLESDSDSNLIDKSTLLSASETLFETAPALVSFDFNGTKVRYFEALETFISDSKLKKLDSLDFLNLEIEKVEEETDAKIIIETKNNLIFTFKDNKLTSLSKISEN